MRAARRRRGCSLAPAPAAAAVRWSVQTVGGSAAAVRARRRPRGGAVVAWQCRRAPVRRAQPTAWLPAATVAGAALLDLAVRRTAARRSWCAAAPASPSSGGRARPGPGTVGALQAPRRGRRRRPRRRRLGSALGRVDGLDPVGDAHRLVLVGAGLRRRRRRARRCCTTSWSRAAPPTCCTASAPSRRRSTSAAGRWRRRVDARDAGADRGRDRRRRRPAGAVRRPAGGGVRARRPPPRRGRPGRSKFDVLGPAAGAPVTRSALAQDAHGDLLVPSPRRPRPQRPSHRRRARLARAARRSRSPAPALPGCWRSRAATSSSPCAPAAACSPYRRHSGSGAWTGRQTIAASGRRARRAGRRRPPGRGLAGRRRHPRPARLAPPLGDGGAGVGLPGFDRGGGRVRVRLRRARAQPEPDTAAAGGSSPAPAHIAPCMPVTNASAARAWASGPATTPISASARRRRAARPARGAGRMVGGELRDDGAHHGDADGAADLAGRVGTPDAMPDLVGSTALMAAPDSAAWSARCRRRAG